MEPKETIAELSQQINSTTKYYKELNNKLKLSTSSMVDDIKRQLNEMILDNEQNNKNNYNQTYSLERLTNDIKKTQLMVKLAKQFNAEMEVATLAGYIDLLNEDTIISIKESSLWKQALGEILIYSTYYPLKKKIIYLFGNAPEYKIEIIKNIYSKYDIELIIDN